MQEENSQHEAFMRAALEEAEKAKNEKEVPVGAVVVYEGKIISAGRNRREMLKNSVFHAEIEAIHRACKKLGRWRLNECSLYVTLEPCPMCTGAIINSRISNLIYGTSDPKAGSCESVINLFNLPYNHKPQVTAGVLKEECSEILSSFFKELRKQKSKVNSN